MTTAAPKVPKRERRDETINLRLSASLRQLIDRAAQVTGTTRSDFVLDSARRSAENTLLDQRLFLLSEEKFNEFVKVLENPPPPNERLVALLKGRDPWEVKKDR